MKTSPAFSMVSLTILLVIQTALAAKGQSKRQVSEPNDENQPPRQRQKLHTSGTTRRGSVGIRGVSSRQNYVGLNPQPLPPPHINETGYFNLPDTFWFTPTDGDARTLAETTHEAITQVFSSYPQSRFAMARMQEQLERHREAWMTGVRTRYISEDTRQGRHDPQFDNWDDMEEYLQQLWHNQYETQLHIFLAMYRDYLLRLLATWFDSFGVPRRDHSDDDPSGLPYHPGPTGVSRNADTS